MFCSSPFAAFSAAALPPPKVEKIVVLCSSLFAAFSAAALLSPIEGENCCVVFLPLGPPSKGGGNCCVVFFPLRCLFAAALSPSEGGESSFFPWYVGILIQINRGKATLSSICVIALLPLRRGMD